MHFRAPKKKGDQEAVALYPQYRVRWNGADLHMFTWLVVSNWSRWLMQLINICSLKCTRMIASHMFSVVRAEFKACLREANASEHQDANDHEDSDADSVGLYRGEKKDAAVNVTIGGHSLVCLNTSRQLVVAVDDAAVHWIRNWLHLT